MCHFSIINYRIKQYITNVHTDTDSSVNAFITSNTTDNKSVNDFIYSNNIDDQIVILSRELQMVKLDESRECILKYIIEKWGDNMPEEVHKLYVQLSLITW